MVANEEIKRLEQIWLVLSDFFQDLNRRNIKVDVSPELRNCKTLTSFIRTSMVHPPQDPTLIDNSMRNLQEILGKIQSNLISAALSVDENYAREWMNQIDRAERVELDLAMIHTPSEFVPGLPRDVEGGWIGLILKKPIDEERIQDIAEQFGVIIEFKDDFHIVIRGERNSAEKAAKDIYELSLE